MSSLCHKTILTISHDPVLQRTRSLILEVAGYTVFGTSNQAETLALMTGTAIDLVVMCPSVPEVARELLAAAVKKEHPSVPILVLGAGWEARCPGADGFINVWEGGPATWVSMVGVMSGSH